MTLLSSIQSILGPQGYYDQADDMAPFLTSWRGGFQGDALLVAFPDSTEKVAKLVKLCTEHRIAIVPQGGNTGLVGASVPNSSGKSIVINLSRMRSIRKIDTLNFTLTAEAGCILQHLQEAAEEAGLLFPLSMASEGSAEVGGFVSTNAGGTAVLHYGNTRELVLGLEVVLPDGEIWHGLRALRKDNTGYDLKQLFIGAEGTLGIITAATFKLFPRPVQITTAFLAVPDISAAISLLSLVRKQSGDTVTAFELISKNALDLVLTHIPDTRSPLEGSSPYYVLAELSSSQEGDFLYTECEAILTAAFEQGWVTDGVIAASLDHRNAFWNIREHISDAVKKAGQGIHFDIAVPTSLVADFMDNTSPIVSKLHPSLMLVPFGHIGDGNIHYNMVVPKEMDKAEFLALKESLKPIVYDAVMHYHGSISAEHGIGVERKEELCRYKSPIELRLMQQIKEALDPLHLMNPGKVVG